MPVFLVCNVLLAGMDVVVGMEAVVADTGVRRMVAGMVAGMAVGEVRVGWLWWLPRMRRLRWLLSVDRGCSYLLDACGRRSRTDCWLGLIARCLRGSN
jgi:hypothetical protein